MGSTKGSSGRLDTRACGSESGVALIMALLALLLLTAVGLTLATSTSTEVQVAANYRWSLQALYNAEAGLEVAKNVLTAAWPTDPNVTAPSWNNPTQSGPPPRAGSWDPSVPVSVHATLASMPARSGTVTRDFEMWQCDRLGRGMGYGIVMPDTVANGSGALENRPSYAGYLLNGAFTVWYRKPLASDTTAGNVRDFNQNDVAPAIEGTDVMIVVSEGVAPSAATSAFSTGERAVQIVEATVYGAPVMPVCEADLTGQAGSGAGGAGADPCSVMQHTFTASGMGVAVGAGDQSKTFTRK